jgi:hypothetical protein
LYGELMPSVTKVGTHINIHIHAARKRGRGKIVQKVKNKTGLKNWAIRGIQSKTPTGSGILRHVTGTPAVTPKNPSAPAPKSNAPTRAPRS